MILKIEEDPKTIPIETLNQMGWDDGNTILWEEMPDGSYSLKKEEKTCQKIEKDLES
tara:strand:- start:60 stop:230 length:171 start_codon:yes stop_codon:yes gene_type:complete